MPFHYKNVLMVGATSGIGAAMADRLIDEGSRVVAVGRRQDRLDSFVTKHGSDKASAVNYDISDSQGMDSFVKKITSEYSDLDCIFLNAGTQSQIDLAQPSTFNLSAFHAEIATNFNSFVDLTVKLLPFLMDKKTETSLIYTTSNLAIVPASSLSAYSVSKAALNAFILCLRDQLRNTSVKIIELSPPVVQTELHDYHADGNGSKLGMPIGPFTDQAYQALASGKDQIVIGTIAGVPVEQFNDMIDKRRTAFEGLAQILRKM